MNAKFYNYFLQYSYLKAIAALLLFFFTGTFTLHSQSLQKAENLLDNKNNSQWSFEENRGQLADENGVVLKDIKYYGRDKGVSIYLRNNKISFVFSKTEVKNNSKPAFSEATGDVPFAFPPPYKGGNRGGFNAPEEAKVSTSRIDLEIIGANPNTQIIAEEKISYYTNYYLAHTPEEGITHVPHYKKLTYRNIYSNIDLVLHVKEKGMKYEFVVHPKGKVSDIKLSWNGTKPDVLADGGIKYASALGEIKESAPFSFIGENGNEVESAFKVKGNVVGFEVGKYDESKSLVIDPMLVWGSYYGANKKDFGEGIITDSDNYVYITGQTYGSLGIATSGTHQSTNNGAADVFIAKFDDKGIRLWGTYYGGELSEYCQSLTIERNKNLYITGMTESSQGIATSGAHQIKFVGLYVNIFIAKFNNNGTRIWATYYGNGLGNVTGGTFGGTRSAQIITDGNNDVLIVGNTMGDTGLATIGAHQPKIIGGGETFIVKFNSNGVRLWGTYYGGSVTKGQWLFDGAWGISVDKDNNIYITGATNSATNIATPGAYQSTLNGTRDAFIVKFNSYGVRLWGTYYGGTNEDKGRKICIDNNGDILVSGSTKSQNGISTPNVHQTTLGGGEDVFIAKFNSNGSIKWGTYYGGNGTEICYGMSLDKNGNIYLTGITTSTSAIATSGAFQTIYGGNLDAFIAKFNSNGIKQWGSYYGGNNGDYGFGISYHEKGVYIVGSTNSFTNIATSNAHLAFYGGGDYDAFISKFQRTGDAGVVTINSPQNICGGIYDLQVSVKNFSSKTPIDNLNIGWSINGITQKDYNWKDTLKPQDTSLIINIGSAYFKAGNNIIKVWTFNPNGGDDIDNSNDTLTKTIYFYPTPEAKTGGNKSICIGSSATIGADAVSGNIYSWTSNPPGLISSQSKLTVTPLITTTYYLKETDTTSGCAKEDSVIITVYPIPDPVIIGDTFICGQGTATFETNSNNPGSIYTWEAEGGNIISGQGTNIITLKIDKTTTTGKIKVTEQNPGGCSASKEKIFIYNYSPLVDLGPDQYICEDYGNLVKLDAGKEFNSYLWYPTGDTTQYIIVKKVNDYYVVVTDQCGNEMKDEVRVASNCQVSIYVPNAFTPNNDAFNLNEVFRPFIENVTEYNFSIYNRWGEKVFTSKDYNIGWDGTYKGNAPIDGIYLWMIECTVKEGAIIRKLNKTGTVQLLR